ncbi:uncharacterized protein PV09_07940 [Verruconis gallopava]|uniref:Trafficking protein particle complex subunit 2 n=1 Tax=Verruconis gallopava TaxID=253628 RepID=A0A0D1YIC2_9PEZI|nr:uncharacterized protein PV09_07940 [Verruconis gallopava]KIW00587.1 hypothetical protein PV09_07940 [Verruconis gallopava]
MSFYFVIVGHRDNPLFEHEFGTSKSGGDGGSRFTQEQRRMNQFIVHASLDVAEEAQWGTQNMYLKYIDRYASSYIFCFLTGGNVKFLLLSNPETHSATNTLTTPGGRSSAAASARLSAQGSMYNPTAAATEEGVKNFFVEVYDVWVKTLMNPFYHTDMVVKSPKFRERVAAAGRRYL